MPEIHPRSDHISGRQLALVEPVEQHIDVIALPCRVPLFAKALIAADPQLNLADPDPSPTSASLCSMRPVASKPAIANEEHVLDRHAKHARTTARLAEPPSCAVVHRRVIKPHGEKRALLGAAGDPYDACAVGLGQRR